MKKTLMLAAWVLNCSSLYAEITVSQGNWRWRKDDGTEQSATWLAETNTTIAVSSLDPLRLRIGVNTSGIPEIYSLHDSLLYRSAGNEDWKYITLNNTDNDFVFEGFNSYTADGEPTTEQISSMSKFTPGKIIVSSDELYVGIPGGNHSELEWCIKPTSHLQANKTYYFKMTGIPDPETYASLLTASVLPINIINFRVRVEGKVIKISWNTDFELNNDHFDIERSADGKTNWQVVATIKGSATTTHTHSYTVYDNTPFEGQNFYRIKQYDIDGKCRESEIRHILISGEKSSMTVFPNPAKENINFTVYGYTGNLITTLTDLKGRLVHKEIISSNAIIRKHKLNLKNKLVPGSYVLQLKGEGFTACSKIIVE
jgi:hypothetical protein